MRKHYLESSAEKSIYEKKLGNKNTERKLEEVSLCLNRILEYRQDRMRQWPYPVR